MVVAKKSTLFLVGGLTAVLVCYPVLAYAQPTQRDAQGKKVLPAHRASIAAPTSSVMVETKKARDTQYVSVTSLRMRDRQTPVRFGPPLPLTKGELLELEQQRPVVPIQGSGKGEEVGMWIGIMAIGLVLAVAMGAALMNKCEGGMCRD